MTTTTLHAARLFSSNATATTEIYTLSLHDALPISATPIDHGDTVDPAVRRNEWGSPARQPGRGDHRSEEHTSELQSRLHLVCRLLLEKKKKSSATPTASPSCPTTPMSSNPWSASQA